MHGTNAADTLGTSQEDPFDESSVAILYNCNASNAKQILYFLIVFKAIVFNNSFT